MGKLLGHICSDEKEEFKRNSYIRQLDLLERREEEEKAIAKGI